MTAAWVWTAIAAVGVAFGAWNLFQAQVDREIARALNGSRRRRTLLARSAFWSEVLRMGTQTIFLLVGIGAILVTPSADDPSPQPPPGWIDFVLTWGLVFAAALVMLNSVRLALLRHRLRVMRAAEQEEEE